MARNRIIPYRKDLKPLARELRKHSTLAEVLLWQEIQKRRLDEQFHRPVPLLDYIVDFYCHEVKLAIEVDGPTHTHEVAADKDAERQQRLEKEGVRMLRFADADVKQRMRWVLNEILYWIEDKRTGL